MKVLHLAPLWYPVAHDSAGGRETLLAALVEAQQEMGCDVTVIASGDSQVGGELVPVMPRHLVAAMQAGTVAEAAYYEQEQLRLALAQAGDYDVIHSHAGWYALVLSAVPGLKNRVLHTHHTPVWSDLQWFVGRHPDYWWSTVSEFLAQGLRHHGACRCRVIPNGIDARAFPSDATPGAALVFIGRIEWSKGPDLAVAAARHSGRPLFLAGPIVDRAYFEQTIASALNDQIQYLGVVGRKQRNQLFAEAFAAVLPFRGAEGMPMTVLEAQACGTPVLSLATGPLPEMIEAGVTGYLATTEAELLSVVENAGHLDRKVIRARVAARFDLRMIARCYLDLYREMRAA